MNPRKKLSLTVVLIAFIFFMTTSTSSASTIGNNSNFFSAQLETSSDLGREFYIENCGSCHVPIPAEVLPTDTWQKILEQPRDHYGESLPKMANITLGLIWNYLRTYSRPILEGETTPEFLTNSRYFKALHPQVDLPKPTSHQSCTLCHPSAATLDYRSLTSEWND